MLRVVESPLCGHRADMGHPALFARYSDENLPFTKVRLVKMRTGLLIAVVTMGGAVSVALVAQTTRKMPPAGVMATPPVGYSYSNVYFAANFVGPVDVSDPDEHGVSHTYIGKSGGFTQSVYLPPVDDPVAVNTATSDGEVQGVLAKNAQVGAVLHGTMAGHPYTEIHVHQTGPGSDSLGSDDSLRMRVIVVSATRMLVVTQAAPWNSNDVSEWNALMGSLVIR